jgi:outer membrane immunogenic protein
MRRFVLAAAMAGMTFGAQAADLPDLPVLRGSLPPGSLNTQMRNWDGFYVGGQLGYASGEMDFSHSVRSLTNFILRNSVLQAPVEQWALLSKNHAQATSFGAFVGRNWQWDDLVFGVEANYTYLTNLQSESRNSMTRIIPGEAAPVGHTLTYVTTLAGRAGLQLKDVITFRGRTGWVVGNALPYVFGGLAVGRTDVSREASVSYDKFDDYDTSVTVGGVTTITHHHDFLGNAVLSSNDKRSNSFVPGWTAGLGMEYCLWGGLFMRGEWEYTRFMNVKDITFSTNQVRLGVGYKF